MHVVQVLVSLNLGGSELVAVELAEFAVAHGHRSTVIAAPGPLAPRLDACGAEHLAWPIGRKRLSTLAYIRRLREWIARERPDVVHAHSRLPAWISRLALRGLPDASRPAWVTSMHGHYSVSRYSAVMASGERVIAVSDHIRDYTLQNYPGTDPARIVTVHGGVSAPLWFIRNQAAVQLLWQSRSVPMMPPFSTPPKASWWLDGVQTATSSPGLPSFMAIFSTRDWRSPSI